MPILGGRGPDSFSRSGALELSAWDPVTVATDVDRGGTDGGLDGLEDLLDLRFPLPFAVERPRGFAVALTLVPSRSDSPPLGGAVDNRCFIDSSFFSFSSASSSFWIIATGNCT